MKIIEINKVVDISEGNTKRKLKIDDIRMSPVSAKIKMDVEGHISDDEFLSLSVTDESGKDLRSSMSAIADEKDTVYCDFELKGTEKKIIITPTFSSDGNEKYFKDEAIEIEIP
nr:DUF5643 domain-containing protein [Paeniclostridium ghonii]